MESKSMSVKDESSGKEIVVNVSENEIIPLEPDCIICGKNVNTLNEHLSIVANTEQVKIDNGNIQSVIKESESLAYFCSQKCYEKFIKILQKGINSEK